MLEVVEIVEYLFEAVFFLLRSHILRQYQRVVG